MLLKYLQLLRLPPPEQSKMDAYAMQVLGPFGNTDFAMQHAAAFETMRRNITVVPANDGITAENRIAMVPLIVDRIFSVSKFRPYGMGQKLILRVARPVVE